MNFTQNNRTEPFLHKKYSLFFLMGCPEKGVVMGIAVNNSLTAIPRILCFDRFHRVILIIMLGPSEVLRSVIEFRIGAETHKLKCV